MASFFRSNSQPTPLQQMIEKVTDVSQTNEDWDSIMKICDHVSMQEDRAKEAMRVIRKRLQINPATSGWRSIALTLTLLEALTKNCGKLFHLQLAQKDFLREFRGILAPKNAPPAAIQEKVLGLIQTWAVAFRDDPDLKDVEQFYQECKQQGIEFPPAEPDSIIKAAVSATATVERPATYTRSTSQPSGNAGNPQQIRSGPPDQVVIRRISAEQLAKLRSELDVVQTNGQIFGEMLVTLQPGEEHPLDFELLMELHKTCKQMQLRIIDLLSQIALDEVTVDLLRYNDEFNNSFKTFESYMQERERRVGPPHIPIPNAAASPTHSATAIPQASPSKILPSSSPRRQDNEPALIKFEDESAALSSGFQNLNMNQASGDLYNKAHSQPTATAAVTTRSVSNNQNVEHDGNRLEQWSTDHPPQASMEDANRTSEGAHQSSTAAASNALHIPTPLANNPDA